MANTYQEMIELVNKNAPGLYDRMSSMEEKHGDEVVEEAECVGKEIREGFDRIEKR